MHQFFPRHAAGTEVLTYSVARELLRRGHTVHLLTGNPEPHDSSSPEIFEEYDFEGIHVYRFNDTDKVTDGSISRISRSYDNDLAASYFNKLLNSFRPDVVHFFHLNRLGTGLIEMCVRAGVPCFMTPTDFWAICPTVQLVYADGSMCSGPSAYGGNCVKHFAQNGTHGLLASALAKKLPTAGADLLVRLTQKGLLPNYSQQIEVKAIGSRLQKNIERINQLDTLFVPNLFMREKLLQYGVSTHLMVQLPFGISGLRDINEEHDKPKVSRRIFNKPLRVGYIGTLAQHKGCHVLIQAFLALTPGDAVLKIYGNPDDFPEYVDTLKHAAFDENSIEFCGTFPNSKITEVIMNLDVLVVPSLWYENTPLVIYSAQAAQCPVVASDFPGISEVIKHDVNGLLFEPGDSGALSRALTSLASKPDLLERLGNNAYHPKSTESYVDELVIHWEK